MARKPKVINGVDHWPCAACPKWQPVEAFHPAPPSALKKSPNVPVRSKCIPCEREARRRQYHRDPERHREYGRENSRRRQRLVVERRQWADREYREHLLERKTYALVAVDRIRPWLQEGILLMGSIEALACEIGVSNGRVNQAIDGEVEFMRVKTVDRLAMYLNRQREFTELLDEPPGYDGWAPRQGARCCEGCGTCWHPHWAKALCQLCYNRQQRGDGGISRDQGSWSTYHPYCVDCGKTDHRHRARGLCNVCHGRHTRSGSLERFPINVVTHTYKKARVGRGIPEREPACTAEPSSG